MEHRALMGIETPRIRRLTGAGARPAGEDCSPCTPPVVIRPSRCAAERLEAARLVGRMYLAEGYVAWSEAQASKAAAEPHFTLHHMLDEALVLVALEGPRVVGTVTVVLDSPAGLPMEALYGPEFQALRKEGRRFCECCSLAVLPEPGHRRGDVVLSLVQVTQGYVACVARASDLCITIKPSHRAFYERIGYELLGGFRVDPRFLNAPTLAMRLPVEKTLRLWREGRMLERSLRLYARCSRPLSREAAARLASEARRSVRSQAEILEWLRLRPEVLLSSSPGQAGHLLGQLQAKGGASVSQVA